MAKKKQLWDLIWMQNGIIKERITDMQGKDKALCNWKANQLRETTHKTGLLLVVKHGEK